MLRGLIAILLGLSGLIASLFVERSALNFPVLQMAIALILFTVLVAIAAFWTPREWFSRLMTNLKNRVKKKRE